MEEQLDRLLALLEREVDLDHLREVDDRYLATFAYENVDRPPLVVRLPFAQAMALPDPWNAFRLYSRQTAFDHPAAMMQNELLRSILPGVLLKDDNPLLIRADYGTIQIAALLGAAWEQRGDNPPWSSRLATRGEIEALASGETPVDPLEGGLVPRSTRAMEFYRAKLSSSPNLRKAIQVVMPDLQGPLDTADQIWHEDFFMAFHDSPELLGSLMTRIVDAMLQVIPRYRELASDRLDAEANAQHLWRIPGRLLIRDDSAILISDRMYAEHVAPHDSRLLEAVGGGSLHFCGKGDHLIEPMLEVGGMRGFDFGQPWLMDIQDVRRKLKAAGAPYVNEQPSVEDLTDGTARREFSTGVVLVYESNDLQDARRVVEAYQRG